MTGGAQGGALAACSGSFAAWLSTGMGTAALTLAGSLVVAEGAAALLVPLVERVHARAVAERLRAVKVDLRRLEALAPSGLGALEHWTRLVLALPVAERYRITFVREPESRWQRIGLGMLQASGVGVVDIADAGGA